jgi:hypothetical protein
VLSSSSGIIVSARRPLNRLLTLVGSAVTTLLARFLPPPLLGRLTSAAAAVAEGAEQALRVGCLRFMVSIMARMRAISESSEEGKASCWGSGQCVSIVSGGCDMLFIVFGALVVVSL